MSVCQSFEPISRIFIPLYRNNNHWLILPFLLECAVFSAYIENVNKSGPKQSVRKDVVSVFHSKKCVRFCASLECKNNVSLYTKSKWRPSVPNNNKGMYFFYFQLRCVRMQHWWETLFHFYHNNVWYSYNMCLR